MTKKYNSKFIAGLAVPICLTITTTGISNPILNTKLNIAYAQGEQSEGFKIYEAEIGGSGSLEFTIESKDSSNDIFNKYWKNVDKLLIDGKDFGFNSESSASKNYTLYGNTVFIGNKDIEAHYNKQKKHKIEFIFKDGSKAAYEDEGYVEPSTTTSTPATNTSYAQKDLVTKVEKNSYGDELNITLADGFKAEDVLKNTKEVVINGKTFNKSLFSKNWKGQIVTFDDGGDSLKAFKAWNFDGDNTIVFKANDDSESKAYTTGNKVAEEKPADNKSTEKQDTPATSVSYAQKDLVTKVEKNSYGDELNITLADGFKAEDVLKNTKEVVINGKTFNKNLFSKNWKGQIVTFDDGGESLKAFKAWNFDGDNTIVFKANDGSESKAYTTGNKVAEEKPTPEKTPEKQAEKTYSLTDKLEDGEYTLGFNALYADGRQGTSMLEGFFDKNVKLVVKDGKMSVTMLNTLFAHGLYDFAIQNKGNWSSGVKENFGEKNSAGQYDKALFTLPVEDLDQIHLGGVIVSYMGSLESDKGNFDKYTTVKLKFKPEIKKGWIGFEIVEKNSEERKKSDDLLQKKLIANGVDTNKDGVVSEEELKNFTGDINLGSFEIDGKVDKGAIYNLDLLKHMGPGVKSFSSDSNNFGEIPEDLFKNAVNIERINLGGNGITKLPEKLFANNSKLKTLNLSANNLGNVPENIFENNPNLESVEFSQSWLSTLPANVFAHNSKLKTVSLSNNKIVSLPDDLFKNNPQLTFLAVTDNELTKLPSSVASLANLTQLYATDNRLTALPENGINLTKLSTLVLNNNNISTLSDELWKTLAKNKATVRLVNNQISNIPLELIKANGSLQILDIANNNLPATLPFSEADTKLLGISPNVTQGYYPQKQAIELNIVAKDNKITIEPKDEKLTILNLLHWYRGRSEYYGGEGILQGLEKYKEFLAKQNKTMAELLKSEDYGRNWYIVTKVERLRGNEVKELTSTSVSNEDDKKLEITDNEMKAGDKYRITKVLYEKNATNIDDKIIEIHTVVDAQIKTEEPKVEDKKETPKPGEITEPKTPAKDDNKAENEPEIKLPKNDEKGKVSDTEFELLRKETLTNIDNDNKLSVSDKEKLVSIVKNAISTDTLVDTLSDGIEVKVQFDNSTVNAEKFVAKLSDEAASLNAEQLVKQLDGNRSVVKTIDLHFTDAQGNIINKQGNTRAVTLTVVVNENEELEVYFVNGDKLEKVPSIYKDGKLTFYTSHFSTYTIVKKSNNNTGNNSNGKLTINDLRGDNSGNTIANSGSEVAPKQGLTGLLPKTGLTTSSISTIALLILGAIVTRFRFRKNK